MTTDSPHIQRLKQSGYRLTQARLTVLAVLEAEHGHITSADVLEKVEGINPAIGRASVFRTLDLFTQLGIIRPTYIDTSLTPTYVMMHGGHHHHVICTACKRFFEFDDCGMEAFDAKPGGDARYSHQRTSVGVLWCLRRLSKASSGSRVK